MSKDSVEPGEPGPSKLECGRLQVHLLGID